MKSLVHFNLENTLLKEKLPLIPLMETLERKKKRADYRELIVKNLKEWKYMSNSYEEIQEMIERVMEHLKDAGEAELKRMVRNMSTLFPFKLEQVNEEEIRKKVMEKRKIKKVLKKDLFDVYE